MNQKSALKLATKMHTGFGIASFVLATLSSIFFIIAIFISAFKNRNFVSVQYTIGILETIAIITCLISIPFGAIGEMTKEVNKIYAHLGLIIGAIAIVFHISVLIFGY